MECVDVGHDRGQRGLCRSGDAQRGCGSEAESDRLDDRPEKEISFIS